MSAARDTSAWERQLADTGYCIIPELVSVAMIADLNEDLDPVFEKSSFGQGYFYGYRTKRFGSLLRRTRLADNLVLEPTILALARKVLEPSCERIQLNVAQAIEIHDGELEQFPHCDHDMWAGPKGQFEYLLNVMWPLSEFNGSNGATRIYPGTHRGVVISLEDLPEPVIAECVPGSAICFLGSTVHGAGPNMSGMPRRGIVIGYSLGWLKPYENSWLTYPPDVARSFSPDLADLAGYALHRPNLGNYEGQCPSVLLGRAVSDNLQATDALRPDQESAVAEFAYAQLVRS